MDGFESWAGGTYGFYWNDATEANAVTAFDSTTCDGNRAPLPLYMFYMSPHIQGQTVSFHNINEQAGGSMMFPAKPRSSGCRYVQLWPRHGDCI